MNKKEKLITEIKGLEKLLFQIENNKKYTKCFVNQIKDKIIFRKYELMQLEKKENEKRN